MYGPVVEGLRGVNASFVFNREAQTGEYSCLLGSLQVLTRTLKNDAPYGFLGARLEPTKEYQNNENQNHQP